MTGRARKRRHYRKRHPYLDGYRPANPYFIIVFMHCGQFLAKRKGSM